MQKKILIDFYDQMYKIDFIKCLIFHLFFKQLHIQCFKHKALPSKEFLHITFN